MITMHNIYELGLTKGAGHTWRRQVTHCVKGHEYTPENTIVREDGSRACRTCKRARKRRATKARTDRAWNEAIEAAATEAQIFGDEGIARAIRALKKHKQKDRLR